MTFNIRRADRSRPEPLWHQAEQALRSLIADGNWPDGTQLPNEGKLSEMLGVSRITIRHALRNRRGIRPASARARPRHLRAHARP